MFIYSFWVYLDGNFKFKIDQIANSEEAARKRISLLWKEYELFNYKVSIPKTPKYHYSGYWHCWSRVLEDDGMYCCRVQLTDINRGFSGKVLSETIIISHSGNDRYDKSSNVLPEDLIHLMEENLGGEFTSRLLDYDYLSDIRSIHPGSLDQIDRSISKLSNGGGIPFKNILNNVYHQWN